MRWLVMGFFETCAYSSASLREGVKCVQTYLIGLLWCGMCQQWQRFVSHSPCCAERPSLQPHQFSYIASDATGETAALFWPDPWGNNSAVSFSFANPIDTVPSS